MARPNRKLKRLTRALIPLTLFGAAACGPPTEPVEIALHEETEPALTEATETPAGEGEGDPTATPVGPEVEDGIDNDRDGRIDEGTDAFDDDGDGYSEATGDGDDADPTTYPGAPELEDGLDNDQDGRVDEGTAAFDDDGDGATEATGDCDDLDAGRHPGAAERPDGLDDDCDGRVDEGTTACDDDGDGFSEDQGDCNDARASVHPGASETAGGKPDGIDNDCDGAVDEGTGVADSDGDGFTLNTGDCDDADPAVYPGAPERANGQDDDCDGEADEGTALFDDDGDGLSEAQGDCDDGDAQVSPEAAERCNDVDDDCNGVVDEPCRPCAVPGDFDDAAEAVAAGCAEVILAASGGGPLVLNDPPGSLTLRAAHGDAHLPGLLLTLTPSDVSRAVRIEGFTFDGPVVVDSGDAQADVTLATLTLTRLTTEGGALTLKGPNLTVDGGVLLYNQATGRGDVAGAIRLTDAPGFALRRLELRENKAPQAVDKAAGALYLAGAETWGTIEACLFDGNEGGAVNGGGAVFIEADVTGEILFLNDTFVRNEDAANEDAAAVRCNGALPGGRFSSLILWHQDGAHIDGCEEASIEYSDVEGRVPDGPGNLSKNPKFREDDSFTPQGNSPCINAGDPDPSRDDPDGSRNDMGYTGGPWGM